jgi:hypothetical protein
MDSQHLPDFFSGEVMGLSENRNRLVSFRLTVEEYESVKRLCLSKGTRSISEFTRGALLKLLERDGVNGGVIIGDLVSVIHSIEEIDQALQDLRSLISNVLGRAERRSDVTQISSSVDFRR